MATPTSQSSGDTNVVKHRVTEQQEHQKDTERTYSGTCQKCDPVLALAFVGLGGISWGSEGQTDPWEGCKQGSFARQRDKFALFRLIEHHPTVILRL